MTVEGMKQLVKVFAPNTGKRQLDYLEEILNEVYRKAGISQDDIESWIRPSPTLDQVLDEIDLVFNSISASMDSGSVSDIMKAYGQAKSKAEKAIVKMKADGKDPLEIEDKVNEILDDLEGVLHGYAKSIWISRRCRTSPLATERSGSSGPRIPFLACAASSRAW